MIKELLRSVFRPSRFYCPVCDKPTDHFNPLPEYYFEMTSKHGYLHSYDDSETMNYKDYECPNCKCCDRDRLYALYLRKYFTVGSGTQKRTFIDFAPTPPLSDFIKRTYKNLNYRTADLMAKNVDDKVDISDMKIYENDTVDFFICSHVLEHVPDAKKAMNELYRILKPGGKGIAMVPILTTITENMEDPGITTAEARWKYYGQDDHLRMYSKNGFIKDLQQADFTVQQLGVKEFGADVFKKAGITPQSVLYIVSK